MKIFKIKNIFFLLLVAGWSGCDNNPDDPGTQDNGKDRKEILTHWADKIVIPAYAAFSTTFDVMVSKHDAFAGSPGEATLIAFRSAWVDAYLGWQKVELFEFGPADRNSIRNFFNIYPTDVTAIQANIGNPAANLEVPAAYASQGFPALDYLINGVGANDAEIISFYTTHPDAAKNLAYLDRLVTRMQTILGKVISEWTTYRETFIAKTGLDIGSSMGLVVNAYVLNYERYIRSGKIGIPSGAAIANNGVAYPEKVEAFYKKDISLALAKNAHEASRGFFNGTEIVAKINGPSFASYLDALGAKDPSSGSMLTEIINAQFTAISEELNGLSDNLYNEAQTNQQGMTDTYDAMQKMVRLIKVDMTSAMSITITYTDNDGD